MNETISETLELQYAPGAGVPRHKQAMLFCAAARALRLLARRIAFGKLSAADRWRIGRALESLESDILLVRIMTREAPDRCPPGGNLLVRNPRLRRRKGEDEV